MRVVTQDTLSEVDPDRECFIVKGVFAPAECAALRQWLGGWLEKCGDNERFLGENWHYTVRKDGTHFHSFLLNGLHTAGEPRALHFYRTLYGIYRALGEDTPLHDFDAEIAAAGPDAKTVNPLVFWYPAGVGRFGWHSHDPEYQRFQLVCNLTQPGEDYTGGETLVDMGGFTETFGAEFAQGDVFGFPYGQRHMVNPVGPGSGPLRCRVSLLMPLLPLRPRKQVTVEY